MRRFGDDQRRPQGRRESWCRRISCLASTLLDEESYGTRVFPLPLARLRPKLSKEAIKRSFALCRRAQLLAGRVWYLVGTGELSADMATILRGGLGDCLHDVRLP